MTQPAIALQMNRDVPRRWHPRVWASLLLGAALWGCALFLYAAPLQSTERLQLANADPSAIAGFDYARSDEQGRSFRWTQGDGSVALDAQGIGAHVLAISLAVSYATASVPVTLTMNDKPLVVVPQGATSRRYQVLVDTQAIRLGENRFHITSSVFQPKANQAARTYGVMVYEIGWRVLPQQRWLVLTQILALTLVCGLLLALLSRGGVPLGFIGLTLLLFLAIAFAMRHGDTRVVERLSAVKATLALAGVFGALLVVLRKPLVAPLATVRAWARIHWLPFVGYLAVTALMLAPLLPHFSTHILSNPGDSYEFLWKIQWFHDALVQQHVSPAFAPQIFLPSGFDLARTDMAPTQTLLTVPITHFFGPVASYNTATFVSFVLAGFFTYLLALRLGATSGAAWVAGLLFAFCTRHFYHLFSGHLNLVAIQWIPLAIYGWEGVLTRRRPWDGWVAGLGLGLSAWASWYYAPTLAGLLAAYTVLRAGRNVAALARCWPAACVAGCVALALTLPLAQPYMEVQSHGETMIHGLDALGDYAALPRDYVAPNIEHPLWGQWSRQFIHSNTNEHLVAPGYTLMLLAFAGAWLARKRGTIVRTLTVLIVINVLLTFGPTLTLAQGIAIPMPVRLIHDHVPVLNSLRAWSRMSLYVMLCGALLASFALSAVPLRWRRGAAGVAAAMVLIEYAAWHPLHEPVSRSVDRWLHDQPNVGAVIQFPRPLDGTSEYYSLFHGKPTLSWHGAFYPPLISDNALDAFPQERSLRLLQRWGGAYVIVNETALQEKPTWRTLLRQSRLVKQVYRNPWYRVYQIVRNPA